MSETNVIPFGALLHDRRRYPGRYDHEPEPKRADQIKIILEELMPEERAQLNRELEERAALSGT